MAFNFDSDHPLTTGRRAYVTNYLDMNVTVLDLQPGSPTENRVIGRIGATQPPAVQM